MNPIRDEIPRLFVGFDPAEALAYSVFCSSVQRHASGPVLIAPLALTQLKEIFNRERDPLQSTDFAFTRFLVPYLCQWHGWAMFMDGDMLCRDDIYKLWAMRDNRYAVQVVQHQYEPAEETKFLGHLQTTYQRKNWSSVVIFNNLQCSMLTPRQVETRSGLYLHQFHWLRDEQIGMLPGDWNHLVGVDDPNPNAKLVHFTLGMPFFHGYNECEFAGEWRAERAEMMNYNNLTKGITK
jgi:hypothetical protein